MPRYSFTTLPATWLGRGLQLDTSAGALTSSTPYADHAPREISASYGVTLALGGQPPPVAKRIAFIASFSPCTNVAGSGARDFATKGGMMLVDAIELFEAGRNAGAWSGAPWMAENPVGVLASLPHIGKPDHYFHPYEFSGHEPADWYTKLTCIWEGNGFVMPKPFFDLERFERGKAQRAEKLRLKDKTFPTPDWPDDRIHKASPGEDRADERSATSMGFSIATFLANASPDAVARYAEQNVGALV